MLSALYFLCNAISSCHLYSLNYNNENELRSRQKQVRLMKILLCFLLILKTSYSMYWLLIFFLTASIPSYKCEVMQAWYHLCVKKVSILKDAKGCCSERLKIVEELCIRVCFSFLFPFSQDKIVRQQVRQISSDWIERYIIQSNFSRNSDDIKKFPVFRCAEKNWFLNFEFESNFEQLK